MGSYDLTDDPHSQARKRSQGQQTKAGRQDLYSQRATVLTSVLCIGEALYEERRTDDTDVALRGPYTGGAV